MIWEDPPEHETATPSNIFVWNIPWTEEPGRLQSMGSQKVGHDLVTEEQMQLFLLYNIDLLLLLIYFFLASRT